MAFNKRGNGGNNDNGNGWEPAKAFVNVYLTNKDGTRGKKLAGIPLKESVKFEAAILKRLQEGDAAAQEAALKGMTSSLMLEFNLADKEIGPLPF